jgi:hypothetical protein
MKLRIVAIVAIVSAISGTALSAYALGQRNVNVNATASAEAESYGACPGGSVEDKRRTYPCVAFDGRYLLLFTERYKATEFTDCASEDGPAPCVWDTALRGNGTAGSGISRFVIIRD